ncbi:Protein of unknown function [Pyronema omphalodes CBS 100304]|uniref:Uncharacterized protein n=1 Tax=Pyronema omphalodes (strain CBS 100304) TaxID=1076935 RepID=U4L309_PYROM|nr:Protein of unknown function [Pyronema omphalodes CBS 100304]
MLASGASELQVAQGRLAFVVGLANMLAGYQPDQLAYWRYVCIHHLIVLLQNFSPSRIKSHACA